jgi:hypothetical protein
MRKMKRLSLSRETLLRLAPDVMREAAGGATVLTHCLTCPITQCDQSICVPTCHLCTRARRRPGRAWPRATINGRPAAPACGRILPVAPQPARFDRRDRHGSMEAAASLVCHRIRSVVSAEAGLAAVGRRPRVRSARIISQGSPRGTNVTKFDAAASPRKTCWR